VFKDHGEAKITIHNDLEEAEKLFPELKSVGIDIRGVTDQLEKEGVQLFSDSFFALLKEIAKKRDLFLSR
jgi:transaldolase